MWKYTRGDTSTLGYDLYMSKCMLEVKNTFPKAINVYAIVLSSVGL